MKSPERLMLDALQLAQSLRSWSTGTGPINEKDNIRAWKQFDALAAEAIAALAKKNQEPSDERKEELRKIGNGLGFILGMRPDTEEADRWYTRWGTKTGLGLILTIERFMLHLGGFSEQFENSMADEARALAAEGEKLFDQARRRKAQLDRKHLGKEEFYAGRDHDQTDQTS